EFPPLLPQLTYIDAPVQAWSVTLAPGRRFVHEEVFMLRFCFCFALACVCLATAASAQLVISGNENKIDLTSGGQKVIANAAADSVSILDFAVFPPKVM